MERQTMRSIIEIIYRLRKGESERAIATDLNHHRATVHQYHRLAREKGYLQADAALPSEQELLLELGEPAQPPVVASTVEPFAELVKEWLSKDVEMKAIHRLLCEQHGYTGSYSAVRRFVAARYPETQEVFVRMETAPAEEAQVDFGTVGKLLHPVTGQLRTAYCFVMTLCHSRHQYTEFVFDQTIATFVACHKRAFAYFGGVVERVVIDNLKAAILKADLEDPVQLSNAL
jgi:transposase